LVAGFAVESTCSVAGATPSEGKSEDGLLLRTALDRIMGPSAVPKTGFVFGLSIINATGSKVGSDDSTSIKKRLTEPLGVFPELPLHKTVMTAAEATIAMAAIVALVAIVVHFFSVAAVAIVLAPLAVEAPVEMAA
jgi:hypothetical protein